MLDITNIGDLDHVDIQVADNTGSVDGGTRCILVDLGLSAIANLGGSVALAAESTEEVDIGLVSPRRGSQSLSRLNQKDAHCYTRRTLAEDLEGSAVGD